MSLRWPVRAIPIAHCKLQIFQFLPSKSHISPFEFPPFIFLPLNFPLRNFTFLPSNFPLWNFTFLPSNFTLRNFTFLPSNFTLFKTLPYKTSLLNLRCYIMGNSTELILIACLESYLTMLPPSGILKSFVQKTAATCFVSPSFVRVAWQGVQQETPEIDKIDDFVTYFDRTWINGQFRLHSGITSITMGQERSCWRLA